MDLEEKLLSYSVQRAEEERERIGEETRRILQGETSENDSYDESGSDGEPAVKKEAVSDDFDPLGERLHGARAGVKGVIQDKKWFDYQQAKKADKEAMRAWHAVRTAGYGSASSAVLVEDGYLMPSTSGSNTSTTAVTPHTAAAADEATAEKPAEEDGSESSEDEYLRSYREKRLQEMRALSVLPQYGRVKILHDKLQFVEEVDKVDGRAFCVVLLFEDFVPECTVVLRLLPDLARASPYTCFFAMPAACASESLDAIGLPAFIVYTQGKTVDVLLRVTDDLGSRPTVDDLAELLRVKGYVK